MHCRETGCDFQREGSAQQVMRLFEDAGQFRIAYVVLGLRYTLRSFERMFYLEYKIDYGRTVDGRSGKDEVTIGIRWDF